MQASKRVSEMQRWQKYQCKKQVESAINELIVHKVRAEKLVLNKGMKDQFFESILKAKEIETHIEPLARELDQNGVRSILIADFLKFNVAMWAEELNDQRSFKQCGYHIKSNNPSPSPSPCHSHCHSPSPSFQPYFSSSSLSYSSPLSLPYTPPISYSSPQAYQFSITTPIAANIQRQFISQDDFAYLQDLYRIL